MGNYLTNTIKLLYSKITKKIKMYYYDNYDQKGLNKVNHITIVIFNNIL